MRAVEMRILRGFSRSVKYDSEACNAGGGRQHQLPVARNDQPIASGSVMNSKSALLLHIILFCRFTKTHQLFLILLLY